MKIALVHDYLGEFGGAERVLLALSEMFPDAPIYTAFWRPGEAWERFKDKDVRVSWAHHIPGFSTRFHSPLRFLAPIIWNSLDLSDFDMVISSASWYVTKGFGTRGTHKKKPIEICYCHTPPRWLYGYTTSVQSRLSRMYGIVVGFFMRQYDFRAAQRVDNFVANSEETKRRIQKFYRREAGVVYPPITVNNKQFTVNSKKKSYFLVVSRLALPKNVELAIRAANSAKFPLKIAGVGPDETRLRALAGSTVEFLGHVTDDELGGLYRGAKAFLALSSDEDFGMTPIEAMAQGTPVIAFSGGGYVETVVDGKTGIFFRSLTVASLLAAIRALQRGHISPRACILRAHQFSYDHFRTQMKQIVDRALLLELP